MNDVMKIVTVLLGVVVLFYLYNNYVVKNDGDVTEQEVVEVMPEDVEELEEKRSKMPLTSDDLLPKDANSQWAKVNPEGKGSIAFKKFLGSWISCRY